MPRKSKISLTWAYVLAFAGLLLTQLPHVWWAYSRLERTSELPVTQYTAFGAAIVFELSLAVFSLRLIFIQGGARSRKWTRAGVVFFVLASILANADYYALGAWASAALPYFLTCAIPVAVYLFTHEFGRNWQEDQKRKEKEAQPEPVVIADPPRKPKHGTRTAIADEDFAHIANGEMTQAQVAEQYGLHESTVSRQYARWRGNGHG